MAVAPRRRNAAGGGAANDFGYGALKGFEQIEKEALHENSLGSRHIERLLMTANKNPMLVRVQIDMIQKAANLCRALDANVSSMLQMNYPKTVVAMMALHEADATLQEAALDLIALTVPHRNTIATDFAGALQCIVRAARNHGVVEHVRKLFCQIAAHTTKAEQCIDPFIEAGCMEIVTAFAMRHEEDLEIAHLTSDVVWNVARLTPKHIPFMASVGVPWVCVQSLKSVGAGNEERRALLLSTLGALAALTTDDAVAVMIGRSDVCPVAVATLEQHPADQELVREACFSLSNILANDTLQKTATDAGCIPLICNALNNHINNISTLVRVIDAIANASKHEENKQAVRNFGTAKQILEIMAAHNLDRNVQYSCLCVLEHLATNRQGQLMILENDGRDAVLNALENHSLDVSVVARVCWVCRNLSTTAENRQYLFKKMAVVEEEEDELDLTAGRAQKVLGVTAQLLNALRNHIGTATVQIPGMGCLWNFAFEEEQVKEMAHFGVATVMMSMSAHPNEQLIQRYGLGALFNLSVDGHTRNLLVSESAIPKIFAAMRQYYRDDSILARNACGCIFNILLDEDNYEPIGREQGVTELVQTCLAKHLADPETVAQVFLAISALAANQKHLNALSSQDIVPLVITALTRNQEHTEAFRDGLRALWSLTLLPSNQEEVGRNDAAIHLILRQQTAFLEDIQVQRNAMGLFRHLAKMAFLRTFMHDEVISVCIKSLQEHKMSAAVQLTGTGLLSDLASDEVQCLQIAELNGIGVLLACLDNHSIDVDINAYALGAMWGLAANCHTAKTLMLDPSINLIVMSLERHGDCHNVVKNGCAVLANLGSHNDAIKLKLGEAGALNIATNALRLDSSTYEAKNELLYEAMRVLGTLSWHSHLCKLLMTMGAPSLILRTMNLNPAATAVQEMGCKCLKHMSMQSNHAHIIVNGEGVKSITVAMRDHPWGETLQAAACLSLSIIAVHGLYTNELIQYDAVNHVTEAMRMHASSLPCQASGAAALTNFATDLNLHIHLQKRMAINRVITAMMTHPDGSPAIENGCAMLSNLMKVGPPATTDTVAVSGAMACIIEGMNMLPNNVTTQERACTTLSLMVTIGNGRAQLVWDKGISPVVCALQTHWRDPALVLPAATVVQHAGKDTEPRDLFVAAGAVEAIVKCLVTHQTDATLTSANLAALESLAINRDCRQRAARSDVVPVVLAALERHLADPTLQQHGLGVLFHMAMENNVRALVARENAYVPVLAAMPHHKKSLRVQRACCNAITEIGRVPSMRLAFTEALAHQQVFRAMQTHPSSASLASSACQAIHSLLDVPDVGSAYEHAKFERISEVATEAGYHLLLKLGTSFCDDEKICFEWLHVLRIMSQTELHQGMIVANALIPEIVRRMRLHAESARIQEVGCHLLANVSSSRGLHFQLLQPPTGAGEEFHILTALLSAATDFQTNPEVQLRVASALASMAESYDLHTVMIDFEAIPALLAAVDAHMSVAGILIPALTALNHMSQVRKAREDVLTLGGFPVLFKASESHPTTTSIQCGSLGVLAACTAAPERGLDGQYPKMKKRFIPPPPQVPEIRVVVNALTQHFLDVGTCEGALGLLCHMCGWQDIDGKEDRDKRARMVYEGKVVAPMLQAMNLHHCLLVQRNGCGLLARIAEAVTLPEKENMIKTGALVLLIRATQHQRTDGATALGFTAAAYHLMYDEWAVSQLVIIRGIEAIITVMESHANTHVFEHGNAVLRQACKLSAARSAVAHFGGVKVVLTSLTHYHGPECETLHSHAIDTFHHFGSGEESYRELLGEQGLVEILHEFIQQQDLLLNSQLQISAANLFALLFQSDSNVVRFEKIDGMVYVINLLKLHSKDPRALSAAFQGLALLFKKRMLRHRFLELNGLEITLEVFVNWKRNFDVIDSSTEALYRIMARDQEVVLQVKKLGTIAEEVRDIQNRWLRDPSIVEHCLNIADLLMPK